MDSVVSALNRAIARQELKQKDVAERVPVDKCQLCRILKRKAKLPPDTAARLFKILKLEGLKEVYCSGCPMGTVNDRRQYRARAA